MQEPTLDQRETSVKPIWITILAILNILSGINAVSRHLFKGIISIQSFTELALFPKIDLVNIIALGVITLLSGIGMVIGKKWGWWTASIIYMYQIIAQVMSIGTIQYVGYLRYIAALLYFTFLMSFMLRERTFTYFQLDFSLRKNMMFRVGATSLVVTIIGQAKSLIVVFIYFLSYFFEN